MSNIVLPGDKLADKPLHIEGALLEGGKTYATVMGLFDAERGSFIPLESVWYPKVEDSVIGVVEDARNGVYTVNMNSPFKGLIISRHGAGPELYGGDIISAIVRSVKRENDKVILILVRPRKLAGGRVIHIRPSKVLRVIGKSNTMLNLLTGGTKSDIVVGIMTTSTLRIASATARGGSSPWRDRGGIVIMMASQFISRAVSYSDFAILSRNVSVTISTVSLCFKPR